MMIVVGQYRHFNPSGEEGYYIVTDVDIRVNIVTVKWLRDGRIERYSIESTERDKILTELEIELI